MAEHREPKRSNVWVDVFIGLIVTGLLLAMLLNNAVVGQNNQAHPLAMAFLQFGMFSTFGELLSQRLATGSWSFRMVVLKALLWGLIGIWIALAFPFTASGVGGLVRGGMWPAALMALSISVWANLLSGYGLTMMLTHRWASQMIDHGMMPPWEIFRAPDFIGWIRVVLISLVVFWTPAHTITFLLPEVWRVLFAALLGVALGVILGFRPKSA